MTATKTTLTLRMVSHDKVNKVYTVYEFTKNGGKAMQVSKDYTHSTSAFAALGRLYQKEIMANAKAEKAQ